MVHMDVWNLTIKVELQGMRGYPFGEKLNCLSSLLNCSPIVLVSFYQTHSNRLCAIDLLLKKGDKTNTCKILEYRVWYYLIFPDNKLCAENYWWWVCENNIDALDNGQRRITLAFSQVFVACRDPFFWWCCFPCIFVESFHNSSLCGPVNIPNWKSCHHIISLWSMYK